MYKKTPSKNTFKELKKLKLIDRCLMLKSSCRSLLARYPLYFFGGMFVCMVVSGVLAFTVMRVDESAKLPAFPAVPTDEIINTTNTIIDSYSTIKELENLQRSIAVIIKKDSLSDRDSIQLRDALKQYEHLQRSMIRSVDTPSIP